MSEHTHPSAWRAQPLGRRGFFRVTAASAAAVTLVAAGCTDDVPTPIAPDPFLLNLPAGDSGLLYYVYMLAIAQATLYEQVVTAPPSDLTPSERAIFADLRDHEVVYRELFKYALDPTGAQQLLPTDFAFNLKPFTLSTRVGVLEAAKQLEDLAAAAYPPLLFLFSNAGTSQLALLLKMSSVHARHAATVRHLLAPGSFAADDVVEATGNFAGQARTKTPTEVMAALAPYFAPYTVSVARLAVPI